MKHFRLLLATLVGLLSLPVGAATFSISAPTANQVFTAPATITVSIGGILPIGIAKVEFYQGSTLIGTDTSAPYTITWSNVAAGSYSLTAKAKTFTGTVLATSTAVPIVVNALPTVSITSPTANQGFPTGSNIALTATAADSDGTVSQVAFYRGTTLIGTATSAPYTVTWSNASAGSYSLTAKATDNRGAVTTSSAIPIVVAAAPTVSLTAPTANRVFTAPATVIVTANATASSGGAISKVEFYQGTTLIGTATGAPYTISWNNAPAGSYSLTAKATDNRGLTTTSAAVPIVVDAAPTVSLTSPAANQAFATGASITLTASAADSDGTVSKIDFYQGTTLIGSATTAPYTITWSNVAAGNYSLTAKATDNRGVVTTSSAVPIAVAATPTVSLTAPTANRVFTAPATVIVTAGATASSGGAISKVEFYQGSTLIGTATGAPYTISWNNAPAGSYSLTAKATDNRGLATTSAAVPIVVDAAPTVSLTAPANNAHLVGPGNVTLSATAADSDGTVSKVDFYQGTTLIGTATAAPYSVVWNNVQPGNYSLTAVATDNQGITTTSAAVTITLVANQPPTVSLATPTAGQQFTAPASIPLAVTAADSDGSVTSVTYFQGGNPIVTVNAAPFSYTWTNVPQGSYTITAQATDSFGAQTTSGPVSITVASAAPATGIYYIHPDHLGTPRLITDSQQNTVWRWDNAEPFGNTPPNPDPGNTGVPFTFNMRYPGQYFDQETGLFYNYFRDYDPSTGRYPEFDPIGLRGGINGYVYVKNQPTRYTDPDGLQVVQGARLGAAIGTAIEPGGGTVVGAVVGAGVGYLLCKDHAEECKQDCADTLERDEAECLVAKAGYGKAAQAICLGKAKEYYAQCLRKCDGK